MKPIAVVADQSGIFRSYVAWKLEDLGYRVLEAAKGWQARRLAARQKRPIDLLIVEADFDGSGGRQLHRQLCMRSPDLRVIYVSWAEGTVSNWLRKPFSGEELEAKVWSLKDGRLDETQRFEITPPPNLPSPVNRTS